MEDEELIPENSDLRHYLESLNLYEDFGENTVKRQVPKVSVLPENNHRNENDRECLDKDIIEQIEEILLTRMLFEEDLVNLERLLSNFKVIKVGLLRSIFENVSGFVVIVLGLCAYWAIGSYVFFIVSIYYSYHAADYLWQKHFNRRRLRVLIGALKSHYNLFRKILKFIKDSDNILQSEVGRDVFSREYEIYKNFKNEFSKAEHEIIMILAKSTKNLIIKFPFYDFIENPHQYVCSTYNQEFSQNSDIMKLYQIYLLVQSEFLLRLSLSLIPNIKISGSLYCFDLYKIIKETSINLKTLQDKLEKKFKCIYLKGIYNTENNINLTSAKKITSNTGNAYKNELMTNIQDMSNLFQLLLIRCRKMENNFSNGNEAQMMENQLIDIQRELNLCQRNVTESIIVFKKFSNNIKYEQDNVIHDIIDETQEDHNNLLIDLSELVPKIKDEVFEAYFTGENENENENKNKNENEFENYFDFEDYLKKKTEKEYSKLVLQELKSKIAETAKVREMREANAVLKKLGEEKKCNDSLLNGIDNKIKVNECSKGKNKLEGNNFVNFEREKNVYQPSIEVSNSNFLTDILKARRNLMQTPVSEEYFCNMEEEISD